METLIIILMISNYIALAILSYKPFKKFANNDILELPGLATTVFPLIWIVLVFTAIYKGFKQMLRKE